MSTTRSLLRFHIFAISVLAGLIQAYAEDKAKQELLVTVSWSGDRGVGTESILFAHDGAMSINWSAMSSNKTFRGEATLAASKFDSFVTELYDELERPSADVEEPASTILYTVTLLRAGRIERSSSIRYETVIRGLSSTRRMEALLGSIIRIVNSKAGYLYVFLSSYSSEESRSIGFLPRGEALHKSVHLRNEGSSKQDTE